MNGLRAAERSTEALLHHETVLENESPRSKLDEDVAGFVDDPPADGD